MTPCSHLSSDESIPCRDNSTNRFDEPIQRKASLDPSRISLKSTLFSSPSTVNSSNQTTDGEEDAEGQR